MAFTITGFKTAMKGDGARPNLFEVSMKLPEGIVNSDKADLERDIKFYAKTAQLPGATIGTVPLFYFGREVKLAGNRTFADWTIQIINDEDFKVRNALERWMSGINSHVTNKRDTTGIIPGTTGYMGSAKVLQYGKTSGADGTSIKAYEFVDIFPVDIAPIDLDWGSNDSVEEFSVTFAYQYWTSNTTDASATN